MISYGRLEIRSLESSFQIRGLLDFTLAKQEI